MTALCCPVCKTTVEQGPACRRCRADLSLLFALEDRRDEALRKARHGLAEGRVGEVLAFARQADFLRHDERSAGLIAIGHLLQRGYGLALEAHSQIKNAMATPKE